MTLYGFSVALRLVHGDSEHRITNQNPFLKQHSWYVCQKGKHESHFSGMVEFGNILCSLPLNVLEG